MTAACVVEVPSRMDGDRRLDQITLRNLLAHDAGRGPGGGRARRIAKHLSPPAQATFTRRAQREAARPLRRSAAGTRGRSIKNPTLVIQGDDDLMIPTKLSHLMAGLIPDARIRIYPDSAHGFLFQYPTEVAAEVNAFLSA